MILIVMGVSGCGKSTIGKKLAEGLNWPFFDGDNFHPPANVAKMSQGISLNDEDRTGWLDALTELIRAHLQDGKSAVLACSALKQVYRDQLAVDPALVQFVYLKGSYDLILARMQARPGHYMRPAMLASQFATLEEPGDAITVDIQNSPQDIVAQVTHRLGF